MALWLCVFVCLSLYLECSSVYLLPSPFTSTSSSVNPVLIPPGQQVWRLEDYSRSQGG